MRQRESDNHPSILLVDDEKNVLKSLSIGLGRYAYDVRFTCSGPEALRLMGEKPYNFVVSDIRMKPMNGYTLAEKVHQGFPETTIVLMSAYGFEDEPVCEAARFVKYKLTKPFPVSDLVDIIQQVTCSKGSALVFSQEKSGMSICQVLGDVGYRSELAYEDPDFEGKTAWEVYDLFFIDAEYLNGNQWTTLNAIDRYAGRKPVFLLSNARGYRDVLETPDVSVIVLDKDRFINDHAWVKEILRNVIEAGN